MKKQYIFLIMIAIILYIFYLILNKTYYEYKINSNIEYIENLNIAIKEKIIKAQKTIQYKSSSAYKNKVLKEQQSFKNKGENVVYLTTQKNYNTYIGVEKKEIEKKDLINITYSKLDNMNIYEKWLYLIFKKDTY